MICFPQEISVEASGSRTGSPAGCEQPVSMGGGGVGLKEAFGRLPSRVKDRMKTG